MKKVNVRPQLTSRLQLIKEGQPNPEELAPQENLKYQINDFLTTKRRKWQPKTLTTYTSILGLSMAQVGEDH